MKTKIVNEMLFKKLITLIIMNALYKFMFPGEESSQVISIAILAMRIIFGIIIMSHGFMKITHFSSLENTFFDPLGVGSQLSLMLAIFAELFCGFAFTIGFLYRVVLIPLIFTMCVIVFIVLAKAPFAQKELPFAYLCMLCIAYIMGPGKYSIDYLFRNMLLKV